MMASIDALASRVEDMLVEQVEEAGVRVTSEVGHVRGLEEITGAFDKSEIALIPRVWSVQISRIPKSSGEACRKGYNILQATQQEIRHK